MIFLSRVIGFLLTRSSSGTNAAWEWASTSPRSLADSAGHSSLQDHGLVFAPPRIPRRCRLRAVVEFAHSDGECAVPPERASAWRAAAINGSERHRGQGRAHGAVLDASAHWRTRPRTEKSRALTRHSSEFGFVKEAQEKVTEHDLRSNGQGMRALLNAPACYVARG